jgi:hypothetical protein
LEVYPFSCRCYLDLSQFGRDVSFKMISEFHRRNSYIDLGTKYFWAFAVSIRHSKQHAGLVDSPEMSVLPLTKARISVPNIGEKKKAMIFLFDTFFENPHNILVPSKVFDVSWQ